MSDRFLLISDLDGTLLGDDPALRRFAQFAHQNHDRLVLVYSSGRFYPSVLESIRNSQLPPPKAIIGGVGTDIRELPGGDPMKSWPEAVCARWDSGKVRHLLRGIPALEPQPEQFQSQYKVSYYINHATLDDLAAIEFRLRDGQIDANLVYSSHRDLDVLPRGVSKGTAAAFLALRWRFQRDRVVVAGNSGNDRALFEQGFLGIVVANAHDELKSLLDPRIHQSRQPFADGVVDGLRRWLNGISPP